jgi:ribonuclease BN (tRNA processing enzyme)
MVFQVQILGVGDYFTEIHNFSSFVIHADGEFTLVDCPDGLRKILRQANAVSDIGVRLEKIEHIILTHLHGDHANGLEGVAFFKRFCQRGGKPRLYSIRDVFKDLWPQKLKAAMKQLYLGPSEGIRSLSARQFQKACERMAFEDYFIPTTLRFGEINQVNNLQVEIYLVKHHVPTFGLKAAYGGKSLGYSGDTFFDPGLIEFLEDCDMIIHECDIQQNPSHQGIHTDYNELVKLPESIKKKLFLIHYPDTARQIDLDLKLLQQGYVYDIG